MYKKLKKIEQKPKWNQVNKYEWNEYIHRDWKSGSEKYNKNIIRWIKSKMWAGRANN